MSFRFDVCFDEPIKRFSLRLVSKGWANIDWKSVRSIEQYIRSDTLYFIYEANKIVFRYVCRIYEKVALDGPSFRCVCVGDDVGS